MNPTRGRARLAAGIALLTVSVALVASGCAAPPASVDAGGEMAAAARLAEPITFREAGAPLDEQREAVGLLTLGEATERAIRSSPDVQAALARVRMAAADASQARLLPNPLLSVIVRWPEGGGKSEVEAGLSADLVALLSRRGRISAADARLRGSAADSVTKVLDVIAEVQARYAAVQAADASLTIFAERLQSIGRLLQLAQDRLDVGEGRSLDVLALQAQRVEVQTELTERQRQRRDERLALARLMGEPSGAADWQLAVADPGASRTSTSERQWVAVALERRPEVKMRRAHLAALGEEAALTRLAPFEGSDVGIEAERTDGNWAIGPGLSSPLPLFDFGQAKRRRAKAAVVEARHALVRLQRQIVEEARRAYATLDASRENLARVRDELIPLAQKRYDQAESLFRGGEADITTMIQAEEALRDARSRFLDLERDAAQALARLERAAGGPGVAAEVTGSSTTQPATDQSQ